MTEHVLETERLTLRQWRAEDLAPFAALNADPEVMEFFPAPLSRAESDALAERERALIAERGWGIWATEVRSTGTFIGLVGLAEVGPGMPFPPTVEIAWRLVRSAWGHGHASEAATAALRFGLEQLELPEIVSFTAELNVRSAAVMKRIGMTFAGTFEHPRVAVGHVLRPHVLYRSERDSPGT